MNIGKKYKKSNRKDFQIIKFGEASFSIQEQQSQQKDFFLECIDKAKINLCDKIWKLHDGIYKSQNWIIIFSRMLTCYSQIINFAGNHHELIIKQIQNTNFQKLVSLNICNCKQNKASNKITNLQSLSLIDFPQLKKLLISNNMITRITTLRKGVFKQILAIHLNCNFINEFSLFATKLNLNAKVLTFQIFPNDKILIEDISFLVRLQPVKLEQIWMNNIFRLKQQKIHSMFSNKQLKKQQQPLQAQIFIN